MLKVVEGARNSEIIYEGLFNRGKHKIAYFHSVMSPEYRSDELDALKADERWGLCVTDAFGLVSSIYFLMVI